MEIVGLQRNKAKLCGMDHDDEIRWVMQFKPNKTPQ